MPRGPDGITEGRGDAPTNVGAYNEKAQEGYMALSLYIGSIAAPYNWVRYGFKALLRA